MKDDNKNSIELNFIDEIDSNSKSKKLLIEKKESLKEDNVEKNYENKNNNKNLLLYGNNIKMKNPKKIGKMWAFLYYKGNPLIVIGPNCKKILFL